MASKREATREQIDRLAKAIEGRMEELTVTQQEVRDADGPSTTTLSHFAQGIAPSPQRRTLDALDVGLKWVPGSAKDCLLKGIAPTPLPDRPSIGDTSVLRPELPNDIDRGALGHLRAAQAQIERAIEILRLAGE